MKSKGFKKPIKYIVVGEPNLTKTSFVKLTGLSYFETDGLDEHELLDLAKYDLTKEVIIIGGKWMHHAPEMLIYLYNQLNNQYEIIIILFQKMR